jgi:hypothetical protein
LGRDAIKQQARSKAHWPSGQHDDVLGFGRSTKAAIHAFCSNIQLGLAAAVRCVLHQGPLRAYSVEKLS